MQRLIGVILSTLDVGDIKLDLVFDATITISGDAVFFDARRDVWTRYVHADMDGYMQIPVRPLLIRNRGTFSLIDTGFGNLKSTGDTSAPDGATMTELAKKGVTPDQISRVILTHAHHDHINGNTLYDREAIVPAFPNAEYVIQKAEAAQTRDSSPEVWELYMNPVARSGQLREIEGDTEFNESVTCLLTRGHTIGHQSVIISSEGKSACYLGDLALHMLNLQHPEWGADWAWSREDDRANRKKVCDWAMKTGGVLILPHDGEHPFVTVADDRTIRAYPPETSKGHL